MTDLEFLEQVSQAEKRLGFASKKFSGAVVTELLRKVCEEQGLKCSRPNSFITDVPIEVDLLIVSSSSYPYLELIYDPKEVIACFEVKKSGMIADSRTKINSDFHRIQTYCPNAKLFYVSLSEDQNRIQEVERSDKSFVFFKRHKGKYSSTGDFDKFVQMLEFLKSSVSVRNEKRALVKIT